MKTHWTPRAANSFEVVFQFLKENYSEMVAESFVRKSFKLIELTSHFPNIWPVYSAPNVRKISVHAHSSIFYRIDEDYLVLLFFWDNRQDPSELKL